MRCPAVAVLPHGARSLGAPPPGLRYPASRRAFRSLHGVIEASSAPHRLWPIPLRNLTLAPGHDEDHRAVANHQLKVFQGQRIHRRLGPVMLRHRATPSCCRGASRLATTLPVLVRIPLATSLKGVRPVVISRGRPGAAAWTGVRAARPPCRCNRRRQSPVASVASVAVDAVPPSDPAGADRIQPLGLSQERGRCNYGDVRSSGDAQAVLRADPSAGQNHYRGPSFPGCARPGQRRRLRVPGRAGLPRDSVDRRSAPAR
jgi:hypothetical protein